VSTRKIAFFDFDGTITKKDTLLEFIKFQKGRLAFYIGFILHAPWLIAYKLKLFPNDLAKQKILSYFFAGIPERVFQEKCDLFADRIIPGLIRPGALEEIGRLRALDFEIVIISASAGNWIRNWTNSLSLQLIATRLEVKDGLITGRIEGRNCHGDQKVVRIRKQWKLAEYEEIFAYGDSSGDKPMLALATKSFYKPFRIT
jgi:HAD-superfamily subfamily IB hydrolase, TIGR01490